MAADSIIHNAKIATNGVPAFVKPLAIKGWQRSSPLVPSDEVLRNVVSRPRSSMPTAGP